MEKLPCGVITGQDPGCLGYKRKRAEGARSDASYGPHHLLAAPSHSRTHLSPPDLLSGQHQRLGRSGELNNAEVCAAPLLIYSVCGTHDFVSLLFRFIPSQMLGVREVNPKRAEVRSCLRHALAHFSHMFVYNMVLVCQLSRNKEIRI